MQQTTFASWRTALRIVAALGWADFRLKYRGSVLGFLWSFAMPLLRFLVIYLVARPFAQTIPSYALYLFIGIVLWEHFSLTTTACIGMLHDKAAVIQRTRFPRFLLVLSTGWLHALVLGAYMSILLIALVALGRFPGWNAAFLLLMALQSTLVALGVGMLLSAYALRYRDIPHLWSVLLQVLFWLTPVLYRTDTVADASRPVGSGMQALLAVVHAAFALFVQWQPLSLILHDTRRILLYADVQGAPGILHTGGVTLLCLAIFALGGFVFSRRSARFLEEY